METNIHKSKYLKYKNKYLKLKSINVNKQNGGGYFYDKNAESIEINRRTGKKYTLYKFKPCVLRANFNENSNFYKKLKDNAEKINMSDKVNLNFPFHLSFLQFELNLSHELNSNRDFGYFDKNSTYISEEFIEYLNYNYLTDEFNYLYVEFLKIFNNVNFKSTNYDFLGEQTIDNKKYKAFIAQLFDIDNKDLITQFRKIFYEIINKFIELVDSTNNKNNRNIKRTFKSKEVTINSNKYYLLYYLKSGETVDNSEPLFAVRDYYFGKGVWSPHISMARIDKDNTNNSIYQNALKINSNNANCLSNFLRYCIDTRVEYKDLSFRIDSSIIKSITFE